MATSASDDESVRTRTQQSPLASQRAKQQASAAAEASRTGRSPGYFPLGYKEGFSQWVSDPASIACRYGAD